MTSRITILAYASVHPLLMWNLSSALLDFLTEIDQPTIENE